MFISNIDGGGDQQDGKGSITLVKNTKGKKLDAKWITSGLNAPKGMRALAGKLYVSDINRVHTIDIATGKILSTVDIKDAKFLNDVAINPAFGYQQLANRKNEIVFTRHLLRSESEASKIDKKVDVFVPYAALKLPGLADYSITAKAEVVMEIDMESRLIQTIEKQNIAFYKPATHTASFVIDSIAVNILDTRGRAWDHSLFSSDAPDIGVEIKLANTIVWQKYFNNTYLFALPATANTISFAISEGDQVTFLIEDRDIMVSDLIATINFKSNEAKNGEWQQYIPGGGNIKACSIFFKVDWDDGSV